MSTDKTVVNNTKSQQKLPIQTSPDQEQVARIDQILSEISPVRADLEKRTSENLGKSRENPELKDYPALYDLAEQKHNPNKVLLDSTAALLEVASAVEESLHSAQEIAGELVERGKAVSAAENRMIQRKAIDALDNLIAYAAVGLAVGIAQDRKEVHDVINQTAAEIRELLSKNHDRYCSVEVSKKLAVTVLTKTFDTTEIAVKYYLGWPDSYTQK